MLVGGINTPKPPFVKTAFLNENRFTVLNGKIKNCPSRKRLNKPSPQGGYLKTQELLLKIFIFIAAFPLRFGSFAEEHINIFLHSLYLFILVAALVALGV